MESILQIIVLLAFMRFACKASAFRSIWAVFLFSAMAAVLSFACYPLVIEQSGNFYETLLSDRQLVGDIAVLITLEAILGMLFSIGLLDTLVIKKKVTKLRYLKYFPELLIIGAVLYAEQQMFYIFPGYDFRLTAALSAGIFALAVGASALFIRWILPELGGRYELNFLINIFLLFAAVLLNAGLSSYNTGNYQSNVQWLSLLIFLLLIAFFVVIGFGWYHLKTKYRNNKKIIKWI